MYAAAYSAVVPHTILVIAIDTRRSRGRRSRSAFRFAGLGPKAETGIDAENFGRTKVATGWAAAKTRTAMRSGVTPRAIQWSHPRASVRRRGRPGAHRCATPRTPMRNAAE